MMASYLIQKILIDDKLTYTFIYNCSPGVVAWLLVVVLFEPLGCSLHKFIHILREDPRKTRDVEPMLV